MSEAQPPTQFNDILTWVFLRGMGLIYLVAFLSAALQADGLLGAHGILPCTELLQAVDGALPGAEKFWRVPTLLWLSPGDAMLHVVTLGGCLTALCALTGFFAAPAFIICLLFYLSILSVGQEFYSFQWDSLLIETGLLTAFIAPWRRFDSRPPSPYPERSALFIWLCRWLLFRLMFLSGLVKLLSGDHAWWSMTAMSYHWETQPLPTPLAWAVHQLPMGFDWLATVSTFIVELLVPLLMLLGKRARFIAAAATFILQVLIALTGNYTFFNFLTILLCISLLYDFNLPPPPGNAWKRAPIYVAIFLFVISVTQVADTLTAGGAISKPAEELVAAVSPFRIVNTYGLFAVMTRTRPEITVSGSSDGKTWHPYVFKFKPGPLKRPPPIVAPFQPRLDWQMWFAALSPLQSNAWFVAFCHRLLQGEPSVIALLERNPFPDKPPLFIRAEIADYHFTDFGEMQRTGQWWKADASKMYMQPISLDAFGE